MLKVDSWQKTSHFKSCDSLAIYFSKLVAVKVVTLGNFSKPVTGNQN